MPTQNSGKRKRVSRACDSCRAAREKCDGQPICSTCVASDRGCTYTANPKKRGIQPGYIRTLELTLAWLFQNSEAETIVNRELCKEAAILLQRDTKESNKLHRSWRRSKFCKDVEKLLSGAEIGDDGSKSPNTDEDSDTEPPLSLQPIFDLSTTPQQTSTSRAPQNKTTPLPSNVWQLFDIYFAYIQSWFPICEKHDILKLSYSYPESGSSGDHAELWSILALASLQEPSITLTPRGMYDTARELIPLELSQFDLGHVKALLLLALFNLSQCHADAAWLVVGHASRILLSMEHSQQTPRYKHVYLGCFFLDQLLSLQLGRLPYLKISDIKQIGKIDENGLEEWAPWVGGPNSISASAQSRTPALTLSTYNRLIDLIGIVSLADFTSNPINIPHGLSGKLEDWEASSSTALNPGILGSDEMPGNPPALLLQAVYRCCRLVVEPAQNWAQLMFDVLDCFQGLFAGVALPAIVHSLLEISGRIISASPQNDILEVRLNDLRASFEGAWRRHVDYAHAPGIQSYSGTQDHTRLLEPRRHGSRPSFGSAIQIPTPESVQMPHLGEYPTLSGDVLPDLEPPLPSQHPQPINLPVVPQLQGFENNPLSNPAVPSLMEQWYPNEPTTSSQNTETFFDELASLDGAERVESQPQFMQNLGFAPDARIADLLTSDFGQLTAILGYLPP